MSQENFPVALKSTIDKLGNDLAQAEVPPVEFIDLDDVVNTANLLGSDNTALLWSMSVLVPTPSDPLYACSFSVGARTVNDPGNYDIMLLVGKLSSVFQEGSLIDVHDYTEALAGPRIGVLSITKVTVLPQEYDKVSGIRMVSLEGRVQRLG